MILSAWGEFGDLTFHTLDVLRISAILTWGVQALVELLRRLTLRFDREIIVPSNFEISANPLAVETFGGDSSFQADTQSGPAVLTASATIVLGTVLSVIALPATGVVILAGYLVTGVAIDPTPVLYTVAALCTLASVSFYFHLLQVIEPAWNGWETI